MALTVKKQQEEFQGLTIRKKLPIPCKCKHEKRDHELYDDGLFFDQPCDKCQCDDFEEMDPFKYIEYVKHINEKLRRKRETLKSRSSKV